jgi:PAS domain S-box-containing protein
MTDPWRPAPEHDSGAGARRGPDPLDRSALVDARALAGVFNEPARLYQLLVESVRDYAIFALDPTGRILSWNPGAQRFKGYMAEEILGRHFSVFYPPEEIARGKPSWELEVATEVGRFEEEGWRVRKDGTRFWANVVITALRDERGDLVGFAKVTRDLTERRAAQDSAIAEARRAAAAEAASRAKSEFLAAMSHELRTPLNAIGGYTELIEMGLVGTVTEQQQQYLERIRRSQQHLLSIITDLLNFSRIEAGQIAYDIGPVPIGSVIETVLPLVGPQAAAKGLTFERRPCTPETVASADRAKVEQVLLNLLSNAVKFTPSGGRITIACALTADRATLVVSDTGIGIPAEKLEAIFDPFVQLGRSLTATQEGTGLGLAISRDLARAMGGDLSAASSDGEGSSFTLVLPRA